MIFKDPWILLCIPVAAVLIFFFKRRLQHSSVRFSSLALLPDAPPSARLVLAKNIIFIRLAVVVLFLIALARPRLPLEETRIETEGIDIVLAIDASGSMRAEDFTIGARRYNRLEVVKRVVEEFIHKRISDRIGMVAFAARAYTVCPLTLDYDWLIENLKRVAIGAIEDGTAVGSAISSSLHRLKDTKAKSKIIILLTDGANNAGKILPLTAAQIAQTLGVKIYTIGTGTKGLAPYPGRDLFGRTVYQRVKIELDEDLLKEIAQRTGGRYFRATDTESLKNIYKEIDALEKTTVEEKGFQEYQELFGLFLIPALVLLLAEVLLSNTLLRKLP